MRFCVVALMLATAAASQLYAQFDDLFQDEMIEDIEESSEDTSRDLLSSDSLDIGGRLHSSLQGYWGRTALPANWDDLMAETEHGLQIRLEADVFLDARPSENVRVFGKVRTSYPFAAQGRGAIEVFELFSDSNWREQVFFRVGKQTVTWGTGYFWRPADILSLVPVDVDDPTAEREGPLAIKASVPVREHSLDMYVIGDETVREIPDLGVAARAVLFLPPVEVSIGGGYQRDNPVRVVSALTLPLGEVVWFGEGRLSFGRQELRLSSTGAPYTLEEDDSRYLSGTLGFRWNAERWKSFLVGQYLYQGEGYSDSDLLPLALAAVGSEQLSASTLQLFGRHHSMLSISRQELLHEDLSGDLQWQAAWNDNPSGLVSAGLGWEWFPGFHLRGSLHYSYGDSPSEFGGYSEDGTATMRNPYGRMGAGLELQIGGGRF